MKNVFKHNPKYQEVTVAEQKLWSRIAVELNGLPGAGAQKTWLQWKRVILRNHFTDGELKKVIIRRLGKM